MELINQLNDFMAAMGIDYAICGGHAIDLFLDKKTRPHKDLDVAIYWEGRDKVIEYMLNDNWDIYEPCGTEHLHKINSVSEQKRLKRNIWCVKPGNKHYTFTEHEKNMFAVYFDNSEQIKLDYIEILFNIRDGDDFCYARNHDIRLKLNDAILKKDKNPLFSPELVLLYKSTASDYPDNQLDYENTISKMDKRQLDWLFNALKIMFPKGHKWLIN